METQENASVMSYKEWAKGNLLIIALFFILSMLFLFVFGGLAVLMSLANQ